MSPDILLTVGVTLALALLSFILYHIRSVSVSIGNLNVSIATMIAENISVNRRLDGLESDVKDMRAEK